MKAITVLLIFCSMIFLFGCASIREDVVTLSEEDLKNAEVVRVVGKNFLSTWRLNSGFIRGALGSQLSQFPADAIKAMDELDALVEKTELEDFDIGYSLGLRVRILGDLVMEALKLYAPKVLKYLPLAL